LLIHSSRDRLIKQIRYWVIPIMFLIFLLVISLRIFSVQS
jgi:hypothetical protein